MAQHAVQQDVEVSPPVFTGNEFTSVEFRIQSMGTIYLSKLWNTDAGELCFLIKDGSAVLKHLSIGDEFDARFMTSSAPRAPEEIRTRIHGIHLETKGRFKGHYLVGLSPVDGPSVQVH